MAGKEFQVLQELIALIRSGKIRVKDVMSNDHVSGGSKVEELFAGIRDDRFTSDESAAQYFYNGNKNSSSYQKLRLTLYRRLITTIFLLDFNQEQSNDRQRAYHECYREWAAAKLLFSQYAYTSAIRICQKLLPKARKFEFTELVVLTLRMLRTHYGLQESDQRQFQQYNQLYKEYLEIWIREGEAEEMYANLVLHYFQQKSGRKAQLQRAQEYYKKLKGALDKYPTYQLQLCGGLIRLIIVSGTTDNEGVLQVCDEMIGIFERKPYTATVPLQVAYYQKLICHTQGKQYKEGKRIGEKCKKLLQDGSFNWFKYQELFLIFLFHTRHYQEAYDIFREVIIHPKLKTLSPANQETWKIFEGFLYYLIGLGKIRPDPKDTYFTKFRLGRFMNETPIFSQDKRGMNIPILIIQILALILQGKYETAIDRIEAIEKYSSRYLRKDDTFRSNCFIRMLLQIPKSGFHRAAVIRKAEKFLEKLQTVPLQLADQPHEVEIIPYEDLWEMALESLDLRFH